MTFGTDPTKGTVENSCIYGIVSSMVSLMKSDPFTIWHGRCKTRSTFNRPHPLRNPQFPTNQDLWRYKCFVGITEKNKKRNETGVSVGRQAEIGEEDFYNLMSTECILDIFG